MKLINVDGHLFHLDGSRYRVGGHAVILSSERTAREYCVLHGMELIPWEDRDREREAESVRMPPPPGGRAWETDGLQKRPGSPEVDEWICYAPGYPAHETIA